MTTGYYPLQVGAFTCAVLLDEASPIGQERFLRRFPEASEAEYREAFAQMGLSFDEADNAFNMLLIKTGTETVLVDTGEGGKPAGGHLLANMAAAGVQPADVSLVILTHSHGDHVLGLTTADGEPVFPRARYVMTAAELEFWEGRIADSAPEQRAILSMLRAQGLRLIDMEAEILPGLTAISLPGHTPGHIGVRVTSEGETLLHLADVLHSPMQIARPDWSARFDVDTQASVPTRQRALAMAAGEGALTMFYHLTFPGLGHITLTDGVGFRWEPVDTDGE